MEGKTDIKDLQTQKAEALVMYKMAKTKYFQNQTDDNWRKFCDAKMLCIHLGVRI